MTDGNEQVMVPSPLGEPNGFHRWLGVFAAALLVIAAIAVLAIRRGSPPDGQQRFESDRHWGIADLAPGWQRLSVGGPTGDPSEPVDEPTLVYELVWSNTIPVDEIGFYGFAEGAEPGGHTITTEGPGLYPEKMAVLGVWRDRPTAVDSMRAFLAGQHELGAPAAEELSDRNGLVVRVGSPDSGEYRAAAWQSGDDVVVFAALELDPARFAELLDHVVPVDAATWTAWARETPLTPDRVRPP